MLSAESGRLTPVDQLPVFTPTGEETVHQGWFIRMQRATFVDPDGTPFSRDIIRHPGAVAVVAVTDDEAVVLVRQYRPAVDRWLLEIPAGTCDVEGEPPEATAGRELAEEVGREAEQLNTFPAMSHKAMSMAARAAGYASSAATVSRICASMPL